MRRSGEVSPAPPTDAVKRSPESMFEPPDRGGEVCARHLAITRLEQTPTRLVARYAGPTESEYDNVSPCQLGRTKEGEFAPLPTVTVFLDGVLLPLTTGELAPLPAITVLLHGVLLPLTTWVFDREETTTGAAAALVGRTTFIQTKSEEGTRFVMEQTQGSPLTMEARMSTHPLPTCGAFGPDRFPLAGASFQEHWEALPTAIQDKYAQIAGFYALLQPYRWVDRLTRGQEARFRYISLPMHWEAVAPLVRNAVHHVPLLTVALELQENKWRYLTVATYNVLVVTFALDDLAVATTGWTRRADLLPPELRSWLEDDQVTIVTSGLMVPFQRFEDGLLLRHQVDADTIFKLYQNLGIITPLFAVATPSLAWMMTFGLGYHHRPMDERRLIHMVGPHQYAAWPDHRHPDWHPDCAVVASPTDSFYFFYEGMGIWAFIYRLLQHGLVYGGMAAVVPVYTLRDLILHFVHNAGQTEREARQRDPLMLASDVVTGAPPMPAFTPEVTRYPVSPLALTEGRARAAQVAAEQRAEALAQEVAVDQQHQYQVELAHGHQEQEQSSPGGRVVRDSPRATRGTSPPPVLLPDDTGAREDMEDGALELEDKALEQEFAASGEESEGAQARAGGGTVPPAHPGYFTTEGKRKLEAAEEAAPADGANSARAEGETHHQVRSSEGDSVRGRPPSVEYVGTVQRKRERTETPRPRPPRPTTATGANRTPLGPTRPGRPPTTSAQPPVQLGEQATSCTVKANVVMDLRERITFSREAGGTAAAPDAALRAGAEDDSPPQNRYAAFDIRSRLDPTNNRSSFSAEAADSVAPSEILTPARGGVNFARRLSMRNRLAPVVPRARAGGQRRPLQEQRLSSPLLSNAERAWNPYMPTPLFHRRCEVCSSQHCSRFIRDTTIPNCAKLREQLSFAPTRRLCDYRRCLASAEHFTSVCPYLHRRCPLCRCRGHGREDRCDLRNEDIMSRLRDDFEEQAHVGLYTRTRCVNVAWGFYPIPPSAVRHAGQPFVDYQRLTSLSVSDALALIEALLSSPDNRGELPPRMGLPSRFSGPSAYGDANIYEPADQAEPQGEDEAQGPALPE